MYRLTFFVTKTIRCKSWIYCGLYDILNVINTLLSSLGLGCYTRSRSWCRGYWNSNMKPTQLPDQWWGFYSIVGTPFRNKQTVNPNLSLVFFICCVGRQGVEELGFKLKQQPFFVNTRLIEIKNDSWTELT